MESVCVGSSSNIQVIGTIGSNTGGATAPTDLYEMSVVGIWIETRTQTQKAP